MFVVGEVVEEEILRVEVVGAEIASLEIIGAENVSIQRFWGFVLWAELMRLLTKKPLAKCS